MIKFDEFETTSESDSLDDLKYKVTLKDVIDDGNITKFVMMIECEFDITDYDYPDLYKGLDNYDEVQVNFTNIYAEWSVKTADIIDDYNEGSSVIIPENRFNKKYEVISKEIINSTNKPEEKKIIDNFVNYGLDELLFGSDRVDGYVQEFILS